MWGCEKTNAEEMTIVMPCINDQCWDADDGPLDDLNDNHDCEVDENNRRPYWDNTRGQTFIPMALSNGYIFNASFSNYLLDALNIDVSGKLRITDPLYTFQPLLLAIHKNMQVRFDFMVESNWIPDQSGYKAINTNPNYKRLTGIDMVHDCPGFSPEEDPTLASTFVRGTLGSDLELYTYGKRKKLK